MEHLCLIARTSPLLATLAAVGAAFLGYKALGFFKTLLDVYVLGGISLKKFGAGQGAWAVVTGASDGIGKEFAEQLAKKKFNVLLVSRTASKLEAIAKDIVDKYGVETKTYAMDFTKGDQNDFAQLGQMMNEIRVGVLVNNVGTNHDIPTPYDEESDKVIDDIIEVNVKGTLRMTKLVLPQMRSNRSGLILNLGSFAGLVPSPYLSVYSGGKAFLSTWTQALAKEVESQGIVVQNVNTYFVVSSMSKIHCVPCGANVPYTSTAYPSHGIANWLISNTLSTKFWINQNYAIQKDVRRRALRKREREAAAAAGASSKTQ
ncbi:3-ketoacyl-reductase [Lichtheimia corymbifera JMRC:FSU:9682]|uniref:3-ketoacyl-reductase n=1 Tax=Lichtheimia corymbifera JMRC:FSU:9682 TaxID=1263082 RepID=A0A068RIB1_9FUNG|nr:3-ketoacyl-reductase [Lichtheimia corymbifera JMRC:FSU:9682]